MGVRELQLLLLWPAVVLAFSGGASGWRGRVCCLLAACIRVMEFAESSLSNKKVVRIQPGFVVIRSGVVREVWFWRWRFVVMLEPFYVGGDELQEV